MHLKSGVMFFLRSDNFWLVADSRVMGKRHFDDSFF